MLPLVVVFIEAVVFYDGRVVRSPNPRQRCHRRHCPRMTPRRQRCRSRFPLSDSVADTVARSPAVNSSALGERPSSTATSSSTSSFSPSLFHPFRLVGRCVLRQRPMACRSSVAMILLLLQYGIRAAVVVVVVARFACCVYVVDVRAKNAQPTQELPAFSVGQTAVSADVGMWREIGDICRVIRHVTGMSPTLPT